MCCSLYSLPQAAQLQRLQQQQNYQPASEAAAPAAAKAAAASAAGHTRKPDQQYVPAIKGLEESPARALLAIDH